jgi:hypothetical protein
MFRGEVGAVLTKVLSTILFENIDQLKSVAAVYFDPYNECDNDRKQIEHLSLLVRPLVKGNESKPQLCTPAQYEDVDGEFAECELFSVVAWDHVSWPGNDFYGGARMTDDGVKAAATNSMAAMTGVEGRYDPLKNTYDPPHEYGVWGNVVSRKQLRIVVEDNLLMYPKSSIEKVLEIIENCFPSVAGDEEFCKAGLVNEKKVQTFGDWMETCEFADPFSIPEEERVFTEPGRYSVYMPTPQGVHETVEIEVHSDGGYSILGRTIEDDRKPKS